MSGMDVEESVQAILQRRCTTYDSDEELRKLAVEIMKLGNFSKDTDITTYNNHAREALRILNHFENVAFLGQAIVQAVESDVAYFVALEKELQAKIDASRNEIIELRQRLGEEKIAMERRKKYNLLAQKIAALPERSKSASAKETVDKEIEKLQSEKEKIEEKKHKAICEFQLLLQSIDDLDSLMKEKDFITTGENGAGNASSRAESKDSAKGDVCMKDIR